VCVCRAVSGVWKGAVMAAALSLQTVFSLQDSFSRVALPARQSNAAWRLQKFSKVSSKVLSCSQFSGAKNLLRIHVCAMRLGGCGCGYGVATIGRLPEIVGLFCRISSLL